MSRQVTALTDCVTVAGGGDMADRRERRGWVVLAAVGAALVLAGVGAGVGGWLAPSASWVARAAGAGVGAIAALAAAIWADRAYQRREGRAGALHARDEVLGALVADPASEGSVFDVLLATSTKAAPFRSRADDLAWLDRQWDDPKQPVVVVTGPAGTGKTRLVTRFAQGRPLPWVSGWLSEGRGADAVAKIRACRDPALILVDDADQRPDLAALLASVKTDPGTEPVVRVILITRAAGLVNRLAGQLDDWSRGMLDDVRELPLGPFGGADDRARWFGEAVRAYARARRVPPPDLPAHLGDYITDPAEPILTLHAQALLAVLDSERSRPMGPRAEGPPFDQVAAALFAHEQHRWKTSAEQSEFGLTDLTGPVQAQAIAALVLASPADQKQAVAMLRRVPDLAKAPAERRANIARWAAHLYPGDPPWPIQIKPDMLAEWFAVTQVITETLELAGLLSVMTPEQQAALLVLLAHASDHIIQAAQLFADIVAADTTHIAEAGVAAALTASAGRRRLDGELARLIGQATWSADALGRIEVQMTERLPRTLAAVAEVWVQIARTNNDAVGLAKALDNLGAGLTGVGRYQEALAATEEAVGLWRPLARDNPAHQPGLAEALDNRGVGLGLLGRYQQGLAATEEAVGLWRPLARDNPAHQPDLARAQTNLGGHLAGGGPPPGGPGCRRGSRRPMAAARPRQPRPPAHPRQGAGKP
jgi:tetratricopeptide (TPR) repeat protein